MVLGQLPHGKLPPHYKISLDCPHSSKFPSKSTTKNYALSTSTVIKESLYQKLFFKAAT